MVGVGRDLCGSSSPNPLPKQGRLQQAAQDLVQAGLSRSLLDCLQLVIPKLIGIIPNSYSRILAFLKLTVLSGIYDDLMYPFDSWVGFFPILITSI